MVVLSCPTSLQQAFKSCKKGSGASQRRALVCRAQSHDEGRTFTPGAQLLAAGLAASIVLGVPSIANAGVQYTQPKLKKSFQKASKPADAQPSESSQAGGGGGLSLPSLPSLPAPSLPSLPTPSLPGLPSLPALPEVNTSGGVDPRSVALPGAIVGIAALGYAAYSLDGGFRAMMKEGLVKDSRGYAGYEESVDEYASQAGKAASKGTKKISKAANKTASKAKGKANETKKGIFGLFN